MTVKYIVTKSEFEAVTGNGVSLVAFGTSWCAPCRLQEPIIDNLAGIFQSQATFAEVDVDENREIARSCNIRNIPTLILYKNGREIIRFTGLQSQSVLSEALEKPLARS